MTTPPDIEALVGQLDDGARVYGNHGNASPATHIGDLMAAASDALRSLSSERERLVEALGKVGAVRPVNWDDDEDAEQAAAWKALDEVLSGPSSPPGEAP